MSENVFVCVCVCAGFGPRLMTTEAFVFSENQIGKQFRYQIFMPFVTIIDQSQLVFKTAYSNMEKYF